MGSTYPWGKEEDHELLTYEMEDAHPEKCTVLGEAETIITLKDRVLTWRGHLSVTSDVKNFYYKYTRELMKDGVPLKTKKWEETIPRDFQ